MKPASKALFLLAALLGPALASAAAMGSSSVVPPGDATYGGLLQLEQSGLLLADAAQGPLTRQEVADRIFGARQKLREVLVAQADLTSPSPAASADGPGASGAPAPDLKVFETPEDLARAEETLRSLEEAYQYELKKVQGDAGSVKDRQGALEAKEYDLWRRIMGITEYPTITFHGLGRGYGYSRQYYGDSPLLSSLGSSTEQAWAFLDLEPMGVVDKQVRWDSIVRYQTAMMSNSSVGIEALLVRRANLEFNPPWFSATLGDFNESFTPLTLWNRNDLDLRYMPEMVARQDARAKYESFFDREPQWPLRGLRIGTDLGWPDSTFLDRFQVEAFAHMLRSGYNDNSSGGGYFGSGEFTDWLFGGRAKLQLKRFYMGGGASLQPGIDAYGIFMDEPLYSQQPGSPYAPFNPATWAHQYKILSVDPYFDLALGDDLSLGGKWEGSFSVYVDDVRDPSKDSSDFALLVSPYVRFGKSRITFNYLNVGPNYFSPAAQARQDDLEVSSLASGPAGSALLSTPLRGQFFLTNVPRAGAIFGFYDRTLDNTFPYGLATPNRIGGGLEFDIKGLDQDAFKFLGSAYLVNEIDYNLVPAPAANGFVPVDGVVVAGGSGPVTLNPKRDFVYINLGPSLDLGPALELPGALEIGLNARYEETHSDIGTLSSLWVLGGARVEVFSWLEMAAAYGVQQFNGDEAGYGGMAIARYAYDYDNSDLAASGGLGYSAFHVDGSRQDWEVSTNFKMGRNSVLSLDYDVTWGDVLPYLGNTTPDGVLNDQFLEVSYEVQF